MFKIHLGVIGAGSITNEHLKVVNKISNFKVVGITSRTNKNCFYLAKKYKISKVYNNYIDMIEDRNIDALLVLVSGDQIYETLNNIISFKKPFFTEKPPGLNTSETKKLCLKCKKYKTLNMVGFNRRFYSIFHKGKKIIENNGGLLGLSIEGHERFWLINKKRNSSILNKWIYANSSHTIDLIRFFGGEIHKINSSSFKYLSKQNNQFASSIKFKSGAIGVYKSFWLSPGGWSVSLFGKGIKVDFKPLEKGIIINKKFKSIVIKPDVTDIKFKPGLYKQMIYFKNLIINSKIEWPAQDICESLKTMQLIKKISNEL